MAMHGFIIKAYWDNNFHIQIIMSYLTLGIDVMIVVIYNNIKIAAHLCHDI